LDFRQLEQFVEVARTGGFARAGKALHVSQPSLTRNIAALERSLGTTLFQRTPKGAVLTEAGAKLLPHATTILDEMDRAHAKFSDGRKDEVAQVRLGASPNFLFDILPAALPELMGEDVAFRVIITTGTYEQLAEATRTRDLDLAICVVPDVSYPTGSRDLIMEPVGEERAVAVARPDHPILQQPYDLEVLSRARWAVPHQLSVSYRFESAFFRHGLNVPNQRLNTSSMSLMRRAILDWGLLGLLPSNIARDDLAAGRLVALETPELQLGYTVGLLLAQGAVRNGPVQLMIDAIHRAVRDDGGR
jgi:DNA-binding transcriptional LysR family regulator